MKKKTKKVDDHHKLIAARRGEKWRRNMMAGRRAAKLTPSTISLIRLKKNVAQATIARKIGASISKFGAIERGKQKVKKDVAIEIAQQLGTKIDRIFKFVGKKKYVAILQKLEL